MDDVDIEIGLDEWEAVMRCVVPALEDDERSALGHVCLRRSDGRRRWIGTDSYRAVVLDAGPSDDDRDLLVPLRLLRSFPLAAGTSGSATLRSGSDEGSTLSMVGPGGAMQVDRQSWSFPDVEEILAQHREEAVASGGVDAVVGGVFGPVARVAPAGGVVRREFVTAARRVGVEPAVKR